MTSRRRLGVALLLDPPRSNEVDGLRRALGDSSLGVIAPHVTLVPPINVRVGELSRALGVVRAAAAQSSPFWVELGPIATFLPASPVIYLEIGGPGRDELGRLRAALLSGPMLRPERWPWVPHVTLADQAPLEQAEAALTALRHYRSRTGFDRVVVMEERERRWHCLADACLGAPAVVGRGGLELEITEGRVVGPDALALVQSDAGVAEAGTGATGGGAAGGGQAGCKASNAAALAASVGTGPGHVSIVLTGRRAGEVVGVSAAWQRGTTGGPGGGTAGGPVQVCVLVDGASRRQGVGRSLLVALEASVRRHGWVTEAVQGYGPEAFYASSSDWVHDVRPPAEA